MEKQSVCRLCLEEKPLLKKSHIIPNFMYRELFDEKKVMYSVQLQKVKGKKVQTGTFESNILCKECDNGILGSLGDYASKVLYGGRGDYGLRMRNERNPHGVEFTACYGVEYHKFKLFLLSLLWRMGISKHDFFRYVSIGNHEETLRKMILEGDPGDPLMYPCFISSYRNHVHLPKEVVSQPLYVNPGDREAYSLLIAGMMYMFLMPDHPQIPDFAEVMLNEKNELRVVHMPEENGRQMLNKYFAAEIF